MTKKSIQGRSTLSNIGQAERILAVVRCEFFLNLTVNFLCKQIIGRVDALPLALSLQMECLHWPSSGWSVHLCVHHLTLCLCDYRKILSAPQNEWQWICLCWNGHKLCTSWKLFLLSCESDVHFLCEVTMARQNSVGWMKLPKLRNRARGFQPGLFRLSPSF